MVDKKAEEITRLITPIQFDGKHPFDGQDSTIDCVETFSTIEFIKEPNRSILSDSEIFKYAPYSKAASEIRLKNGVGDYSDIFKVNESVFPKIGAYYVVLVCAAIAIGANKFLEYIYLVLTIVPLIYLFYIFSFGHYKKSAKKVEKVKEETPEVETPEPKVNTEFNGIDSLKKYYVDVNILKDQYDVKEEVVKELIAQRFEPPQMTYTKFIGAIDECHEFFYDQYNAAVNIVQLAAEDSPRIRNELDEKIKILQKLIDQIEDLTNEFVIAISSDKTEEDVNILKENMDDLIKTVKNYE